MSDEAESKRERANPTANTEKRDSVADRITSETVKES
jgi:hypothetical protein